MQCERLSKHHFVSETATQTVRQKAGNEAGSLQNLYQQPDIKKAFALTWDSICPDNVLAEEGGPVQVDLKLHTPF